MVYRALICGCLLALQSAAAADVASRPAQEAKVAPAQASTEQPYALCPDDEFTIHSLQLKEVADKTYRLDQNGDATFPLIGRQHLSGKTLNEAELTLAEKFKTFYLEPDIAMSLGNRHRESASVIGAVGTPGIQTIHDSVRLLDVLSAAGGLRPDAGPVIRVTRQMKENGPILHATAKEVEPGISVAEINAKRLMDTRDIADNVTILPHDVVTVPPAEVVYVVGNVKRAGGFSLGGRPNLSVLQALSLAEGLDPRASARHARILRKDLAQAGHDSEIPVDLRSIMNGTSPDVSLRPNDILFVPSSTTKVVSTRSIEAAIQIGTGILIFH